MAEHRDYRALEWVGAEIENALARAWAAYQAWLENHEEASRMRTCLGHVHQASGSLRMVEFSAPALLAEALEHCAQALLDGDVPTPLHDSAVQALQAGLQGLRDTLASLCAHRRHDLLPVMMLINDLRAVIQRPLVSETVLFQPMLPVLGAVKESPLQGAELNAVAQKLRQLYQLALTQWLRGEEPHKNLNYLARVAARLVKLTAGGPQEPLWKTVIAVCEGLLNGSIPFGAALNVLLRRLDGQLKAIVEQGAAALQRSPPGFLLRNLLFYVSVSNASSRFISEMRQQYQLDDALVLEPQNLQVRQALAGQLRQIAAHPTASAADWLRIADALALLGMARLLVDFRTQAWRQRRGAGASAEVLERLAEALDEPGVKLSASVTALFNESAEAQDQLDGAFAAVATESRIVLEQVREAIVEFAARQWSHDSLQDVPHYLAAVQGSLIMADLPRAAAVLSICKHYVAEQLLNQQQVPEWRLLDTLADAISGVDYFLEHVDCRDSAAAEAALAMAERSGGRLQADTALESGPESAAGNESAAVIEAVEDRALAAPAEGGEAAPATAVDIEPVDPEIAGIFIEEAVEVLEALDSLLPDWQKKPDDAEGLQEVRRAFHTLKGSGRMVEARVVSELAWAVENLLNHVMDRAVSPSPALIEVVLAAHREMPALVDAFARGAVLAESDPATAARVAQLQAGAEALASGEPWVPSSLMGTREGTTAEARPEPGKEEHEPSQAQEPAASPADTPEWAQFPGAPSRMEAVGEESQAPSSDVPARQVVETVPRGDGALGGEGVEVDQEGEEEIDRVLLGIFAAEASTHLQVLDAFIDEALTVEEARYSDDLQRALHTLKGSAQMAGMSPIAAVVTPIEHLVKALRAAQKPLDAEVLVLLVEGASLLHQGLDQLETTPLQPLAGSEELSRRVEALVDARLAVESPLEAGAGAGLPPHLFQRLLNEAMDMVSTATDEVQRWQQGQLIGSRRLALVTTLGRVAEHAGCMNQPLLEELVHALQVLLRQGTERSDFPGEDFFQWVLAALDAMVDMLDRLAAQQYPEMDRTLLAALRDFRFADQDDAVAAASHDGASATGAAPGASDPAPVVDPSLVIGDPAQHRGGEPLAAVSLQPTSASTDSIHVDSEMDAEILEIFLEEAIELLEGIDGAVHGWQAAPENRDHLDDLQRLLHTLKGGARLAGLIELGDLSHDLETLLMDVQSRHAPPDAALMDTVLSYQDQLAARIEALQHGAATAGAPSPESMNDDAMPASAHHERPSQEEVPARSGPTPTGPGLASAADKDRSSVVVPFQRSNEDASDLPLLDGTLRTHDTSGELPVEADFRASLRRGPQEMVRVSAQLLENLVNLAGETSIARARSEEQVSEFTFALDEMQITVDRLQEQVRRLDRETEAQILFRQEQVESEGLEGFDPLEFDRYSLLQQLSRSLLESASDLMDIKSTLGDKSRDMEQLLVQQSRINTELQEGLMRSRMVPFSRMVPRLRRIVRQAAGELDKAVEFVVDNAEGELDRTVLEKIIAPLEHMLRNAVDHGIETVEERRIAGKPSSGTVRLSLAREGGEVVIRLADDGAGVDLEAVRCKAVERGLMDPETMLTDQEVLQFILQAGFSTAQRVTQISGRGVGLDVVASDIKQLGGHVEIHSRRGEGSEFTIRLPFTVSVNRALMVQVAGDTYAIPFNTIEGIVRVSPFELEAYYQPDAPPFEYAGQEYLMRYLGALLQISGQPNLEGQVTPLPVILVRGSDHAVAVQVDGLLGSREIVVKALGPQFARVQGLSGATVLGDGSVVVILDLLAMIRATTPYALPHNLALEQENRAPRVEERPLCVMVVDDSVTVRKVTSRFLERQGIEVLLARDGVEAVTQLQEAETLPDIMLLDIEMPRMDGFEVASRIRHTSRLQSMPIIMITSRTGDKHRERALSLGVDRYLGKPYQEGPLLETIYQLTGRAAAPLVE